MDANISALVKISPDHPVKKRYDTISKILCGNPKATTDNGIQWVRNFCLHANIRPLSEYGLSEALFNKIIEKGVIASSMRGNAVTLSEVELRTILKRSL
jgi:alcohol dehydrogenase class IV